MEDMFSKHPEICKKVLRLLDNKSLSKLRQVNRSLQKIMDNEKIYQNRFNNVMKTYVKDLFANHLNHNEIQTRIRMLRGRSFLHFATVAGQYESVKNIFLRTEDKNPKDNLGKTPLHYAAEYGHKEIFLLIFGKIGKKLIYITISVDASVCPYDVHSSVHFFHPINKC